MHLHVALFGLIAATNVPSRVEPQFLIYPEVFNRTTIVVIIVVRLSFGGAWNPARLILREVSAQILSTPASSSFSSSSAGCYLQGSFNLLFY